MDSFLDVEIDSGRLRGGRRDAAYAFLGVPYATAPTGTRRFGPPGPAPAWRGLREADRPGPRCPQVLENLVQWPVFAWYGQDGPFDEDCCVLNVFTPGPPSGSSSGGLRPVIFYVHGGGYTAGGGGGAVLDGRRLAAFGDVVVVTVNHRLNAFGYTPFADAAWADAGCAGQLDLVAALHWVRRNIAAFGGDPGNVTLMGQSGGGNKVMVLLMMPAARGLFRRAVNMSGASGLQLARPAQVQPYVDALLHEAGASARQPAPLQALSAARLLLARQRAMQAARMDGAQPVVDGRHVLASPFDADGLALQADVPLLIGVTDSEATLFLGQDRRNFAVDEAELTARIQAQFGLAPAETASLIDAYRQDEPGRSAADVLAQLASDVLARGPLLRAAEAKAAAGGAPVYLYHFGWRIPQEGGVWRSAHTVDIPFAFGTLDHARGMTGLATEAGSVAHAVSRQLMSALVAFARDGRPGWAAYDTARRATQVLDGDSRVVADHHGIARRASAPLLRLAPAALLRGPLIRGRS